MHSHAGAWERGKCGIIAGMKELNEITVKHAGGEYSVHVGAGAIERMELLDFGAGAVAVVSTEKISKALAEYVGYVSYSANYEIIKLPDGEEYKNLESVNKIISECIQMGMHRDGAIIAFGGGVVGDIVGFAAASYMRGVNLIQIPTTLLAMVDSAVGGKTGVNHAKGKNLIGAFHQPAAVFCDTDFLATLPKREYHAGLAEIVKYGLLGIDDKDFFAWLEKNAGELLNYKKRGNFALQEAISRSVKMKAKIVETDEREISGRRALLNLGHTFAHAAENAAGYGTWMHGEAVAAGLVAAAKLSEKIAKFPAEDTKRIIELLKKFNLPVSFNGIETDKILRAMQTDKKFRSGAHYFILLKSIGDAYYDNIIFDYLPRKVLEEM